MYLLLCDRLMNALEESASLILVCHFLLILGGTCFAAFSFVMVRFLLSGRNDKPDHVRDISNVNTYYTKTTSGNNSSFSV